MSKSRKRGDRMKALRHAVSCSAELLAAASLADDGDEDPGPPSPPVSALGLRWYALAVAAHRDFDVWREINKAGITAYCPLRTSFVKPHRHARTRIERPFPLLEGYVFVGFPDGEADWPTVLSIKHVKGRIGINDRPSLIREAQIQRLIDRQARGIYRTNGSLRGMVREESHVRVGDTVRVDLAPGVSREGVVSQVMGRRAILDGLGLFSGCAVIVEDVTMLEVTD